MSWTMIFASLLGIAGLVLVARLLRLGESPIGGPDEACRIAEEMLAGFIARRALVSKDGRVALVGGNGTIAVLKRHGAHVAARRLVPPIVMYPAVEGVTIETGERMFGSLTLFGVVIDDVRRLEAPLTLV